MSDIQEMVRLLRICSNNLNQYTRRANETGSIYAADVDDLRTRLDSLWDGMDKLLRGGRIFWYARLSSFRLLFRGRRFMGGSGGCPGLFELSA